MKIYDALEDNFLKDKAIEINFSKPINKKEKDFLKFLFVEFTLKKDFQKKEILEISINKLQKELNYTNTSSLCKFLDNLLSKKIIYSISNKKKKIFYGNFPIFSSYNISFDFVYLLLSKELLLSAKEKTLYSLLNINLLVFMRERSSYNLYRYLIANTTNMNYIDIPLDLLKEIINSDDKYERFFDFETKILKKIIEDINDFSHFKVDYTKIKIGEFKNNRVDRIHFTVKSRDYINKQILLKEDLNKVLNLIKDDIKDFHSIQNLISKYIDKKGVDYVYKNALLVKNNPKGSFEQNLKKALLLDLTNEFNNRKFIEIINVNDIFSNTFFIQLVLSVEMKKLELDFELQTLLDTRFFNKTSILKDGQTLEENFGTFKVFIQYNKKIKSIIKLFILEPATVKDVSDNK